MLAGDLDWICNNNMYCFLLLLLLLQLQFAATVVSEFCALRIV